MDKHTVDGRNPAPVDMVNIPLFTQFYISQVAQDFFHQQYLCVFLCQFGATRFQSETKFTGPNVQKVLSPIGGPRSGALNAKMLASW